MTTTKTTYDEVDYARGYVPQHVGTTVPQLSEVALRNMKLSVADIRLLLAITEVCSHPDSKDILPTLLEDCWRHRSFWARDNVEE